MKRGAWLSLLLLACGPAPAPASPQSSVGCDAARVLAGRAWSRLAERCDAAAQSPSVASGEPLALLNVHAALDRHLSRLESSSRAVSSEEALELSGSVMDGLDEVSGELPNALRARADDAAEALLAERGPGAVRATRGALEVTEEVIDHLRPGFRQGRERRAATRELGRRARQAAEAYDRDVPTGDRQADRAEMAPIPDGAAAVDEARSSAIEASREARITCQVPRTLAVPRGL